MTNTAVESPARERRVPHPGEVVHVRGMLWAVTDVREQGLPRSPADDGQPIRNHVVELQSLAEDRLGEELTVLWELEVGQSVAPDQGLPDTITTNGFDDPARLAAFVDAVRWGAVTSADPGAFQAPFRSGANVEPYQLEPLRRALEAPRANLLLADDVGLGKTIEAGLVIQELLLRHRARSVVIVCPPSLQVKWREEMLEKFGLQFTIVNSDLMAQVRRTHGLNANPLKIFPRVIVSMAWLPGLRAQRLLRDATADLADTASARRHAFDVLVVDEAHHVAPSSPSRTGQGRGYAVDSQRTTAVRELAKVCEHRLFLSATPHNGHSESFTALLEMIDNRRFSRGANVDEDALREVTIRRLKKDIHEKGFLPRELKSISFSPSADETDAFETLDRILTASAKKNGQKRSSDIVSMLLKKRFLSSPYAFATTLRLYDDASGGAWDPQVDEDEYYAEVLGSEQSDEEEGLSQQPEFDALRRSKQSNPLSAATSDEISKLVAWGEGYEARPNSRLTALINWLDVICRPGGHWSNERVVIFTEYATTLQWIVENLRQRGYDEKRLAVIQGATDAEDRERIRARFTTNPAEEPVRVLVATDSAGEGIDLQTYCHRLVNFDVPFNPSRLEQRIGRIDRYGQTETPQVFQFQPDQDASTYGADMDFMRRIAEKVAQVAADLGSVNLVIDAEVQNHFGSVEVHARTSVKDDGSAIINKTLAGGAEVSRQLTKLASTFEAQQERLHLSPKNAARVLTTALALSGQPPLEAVGSEDVDADVFAVPDLGREWHHAVAPLHSLLRPEIRRPITFDGDAANSVPDGELVHVHLGHPLLQKAARTLRASLFDTRHDLNRVTAVTLDGVEQSSVAAVCRLVLVGRGGMRLHEEVFIAGIRLRGRQLAEERVERLLETSLDDDIPLASEAVRSELVRAWEEEEGRLRERLEAAVEGKAAKRQAAVEQDLAKRQDADVTRAREIYTAFRRNLEESRRQMEELWKAEQTALFSMDPESTRQLRRDIDKMSERLANLDAEEETEITAIRDRYRDVRPFVSTAAVVFALTPADAEKEVTG
ncbi:DISARM system SNF2-like helicase DrmD [Microbacterium sp.]|uniref:DISARM system SNF2-like helicase DrmD n=1 Tax=Microbacterium sp. TaxID=51671 RepID=UPI00261DB00A|nr:DISARM system SNF2-like helicase DrmD [Microbacterium sp.]